MSSPTTHDDNPFATLTEADAPVKDRLTTTLFLVALFHGIIILGVTFTAPLRGGGDSPSLEVLLLPDEALEEAANPTAFYLAQRNQRGSGTTLEAVPASTPPPSLPTELLGQLDGGGLEFHKGDEGIPADELIVTRSPRTEITYVNGDTSADRRQEVPQATQGPDTPVLASAAVEDELALRGKRTLELTPDTRESRIAPYLDAWRRKVERLGTVNYPNEARRRALEGNPVLEVTIRANGSLEDIRVRRSSGHPEIDQAALGILRLASPFDPFPAELKAKYDRLRFAYEWRFVGGGATRGRVSVDQTEVR